MAALTFKKPAALARIERIRELVRQQPSTMQEIADAVYISVRCVREYIDHMRSADMLHIHEFRKIKRPDYTVYKAVYGYGPGKDAPRPDRSSTARQAEFRAKINADPEAKQRELALRRAKAIKPHTDWTSAWIPRRTQEDA